MYAERGRSHGTSVLCPSSFVIGGSRITVLEIRVTLLFTIYGDQANDQGRRTRDHSMKLAGKVALVTGASAGIGRASAIALAQEGADVALNYLGYDESAEKAAAQIRGLGRRALLLP